MFLKCLHTPQHMFRPWLRSSPDDHSRGHTTKRGLRVPNPNSRGHATKRGLRAPNPNSRGHATKRGLRVPNPNSRGHATKRGLRVPNPNSRGHATKRGLRDPNPNSRGPKEGGNAMSPLHSRGSPNKGEQNQKWVPHPCLLGGPQVGGNATSPLHSRGSPTKGNKIRIGCLTLAFSGAHKWAEMLRHPCILGDPQQRGTKSELAASPLPSRGPTSGRKCYVTPAFSGIPKQGDQNQNWLPPPCLLGGPQKGGQTWPTSGQCKKAPEGGP